MAETNPQGRLVRAKKFLAIAESKDSKREAYKAATAEISKYKQETGDNAVEIAIALGRVVVHDDRAQRQAGSMYVRTLLAWKDAGYPGESPFEAGYATRTAPPEVSHTKKVLREQSTDRIEEILDDLPDAAIKKVAEATERTKITRKLYPDKPKPQTKKARQKAKAKDTETLKRNPAEATARLGAVVGSARASIRAVVQQYEEFLALVDDEDFLEEGRERVVTLRADADLALSEALEGSIEKAFSHLLD